MVLASHCHCGKVSVLFETQKSPQELGVRTCQCDFCRRHGAVNISDPDGRITIDCGEDSVERYRFALRTADFLICRTCGVYIAAAMGEGQRIVSTLNVAGLRIKELADVEEAPMEYGDETTEARIARRFQKWTPTTFTNAALAASNFGPH